MTVVFYSTSVRSIALELCGLPSFWYDAHHSLAVNDCPIDTVFILRACGRTVMKLRASRWPVCE